LIVSGLVSCVPSYIYKLPIFFFRVLTLLFLNDEGNTKFLNENAVFRKEALGSIIDICMYL